jgi:hypothetical protein
MDEIEFYESELNLSDLITEYQNYKMPLLKMRDKYNEKKEKKEILKYNKLIFFIINSSY